MLERRHRLTTSAQFSTATRQGRRAGTRTLVAHLVTSDPHREVPGVGFVVGRAVGNAVTRNRVRRRLRHLVRERLVALTGTPVLVVRALPGSAAASYAELGRDLDRALGRLGLGAGR